MGYQADSTADFFFRSGTNIAAWDLGSGESEVLGFALQHPEFCAIVDDKAARRCGKTLGAKILGTGGMLILAKRKKLIGSVASALDQLRASGLWLSDELVKLFLDEADEKFNAG